MIEWFTRISESIKNFSPDLGIWFGVVGAAFFTVVGGFYTYKNGVNAGINEKILSGKIDHGNMLGTSNNEILEKLQQRNKDLEDEVRLLRKDNEGLRKASIVINDNITGGNSSCFLEFIPTTEGIAYIFLKQEGEYPLGISEKLTT